MTIRANIWKAPIQNLMCHVSIVRNSIIIRSRLNPAPSPLCPLLSKADARADIIRGMTVFRELAMVRVDQFCLSNISQQDM